MRSVHGSYRGKRLFDVVVAGLLALPGVVVGAICALAIKLTSPGPILFRQERVGFAGLSFTVLKFRTMVHDSLENSIYPDPRRITAVGRVLRRYSLDELPQLINVMRGEMSVVGPRPTLRYQVERYDQRQLGRLAVRPGLTGLAQVQGRNAITWAQRIDIDLEYVDRQSVWLDLRILGETLGAVLQGSGVEGHPIDDPIADPRDS